MKFCKFFIFSKKKFLSFLLLCTVFTGSFAHNLDLSFNIFGRTSFFKDKTLDLFEIGDIPFGTAQLDYEFKLSERNFLSAGADISFANIPYFGANGKYTFFLQKPGECKKYWCFETEVQAGLIPYYLSTEDDDDEGKLFIYPRFSFIPKFTLKPLDRGLFLDLGPYVSLTVLPEEEDSVIVTGGFTVGFGYRF